jgi:hypothetical protein
MRLPQAIPRRVHRLVAAIELLELEEVTAGQLAQGLELTGDRRALVGPEAARDERRQHAIGREGVAEPRRLLDERHGAP